MRNLLKEVRSKILVYDGSKGTMMQQLGMGGGECPELWNVTRPDDIKQLYMQYKEAGADIIQTNTFQSNRMKLDQYGLGDRMYELNYEGARLAREVMRGDGFVAASIGPLGKLLEPLGELTFEKAFSVFKEQVQAVVDGGVDMINFETFTDLAEMRAALLAAKEVTRLPVLCSMAYESNGKTLMGTEPYIAAVVLSSLGADIVGVNCSFGPEHSLPILQKMQQAGEIYLAAKPNAGLPQVIDGKTVYDLSIEQFAAYGPKLVECGARIVGGCCGTTPDHIRALKQALQDCIIEPTPEIVHMPVITSLSKHLFMEKPEALQIGHMDTRLDQELKDELDNGHYDGIEDLALDVAAEGYDAIRICMDNVACIEEALPIFINQTQGYIKEPLIIDTAHAGALEKSLRVYRGKAGVAIGHLKDTTLVEVIRVANKYGATLIQMP